MERDIELRAILIKTMIEEDFKNFNDPELETFFDKFRNDKRTLSFIEYYNKTILDKEKIKFSEFKSKWAIQGMTKEIYLYFDENYESLREEIVYKKDIRTFFEKHCVKKRKESSFCSKLFHTFLPSEFPPIDNPIRKKFNLNKEDFITSVLIIKRAYELFINQNPDFIKRIRIVLSKNKFAYLRINELSDIRILDMYYWFKLNREEITLRKKNEAYS